MQILNAIREHYLMKREADHGSQLFWDRIFLGQGLQSFTPERLCCQAEKMAEGLASPALLLCLRTWGPAQAPAFPAHAGLSCSVLARA